MDIKNISLNEHLTLKPLPPKILLCTNCKTDFTSYLKTNAEYYKTCNECRHKIRLQGRKHRKDYKQFILDLK
jgi:DNA-directed RNA polymerase subunit RPC12/RpoP